MDMEIIEPYYAKKIIVVQTGTTYRENLGDGDTGYSCFISYELYSSVPNLIFNNEDWIETFGLISKQLRQSHFESTNSLWTNETKERYDAKEKRFINDSIPQLFSYPINEEPIINQFKTKRIIEILNGSKSPYHYDFFTSNENILKTYWGDMYKRNLNPEREGCPYKIDLLKDTNVSDMPLPNLLNDNKLHIYLDLGVEQIAEDFYGIFIYSNIENLFNFLPFELSDQIVSIIKNAPGSLSKKLIEIVYLLNDYVEWWGYNKKFGWHPEPIIKYFIGNEIVCKHKCFVDNFNQKVQICRYIQELKSKKGTINNCNIDLFDNSIKDNKNNLDFNNNLNIFE